MYYDLFKDELIKRYMFLYENRELILAMCIRKINVDDELKESIKSWEAHMNRLRISDKSIFLDIIDSYKKQIGKEKLFLCKDISEELVSAFEEVLFTDSNLEDTELYKHIFALKNHSLLFESTVDLLDSLNERRSYNQFLKNYPAFSVWKILDYVRCKYEDNAVVLAALDKYYNIDRTIISGVDSDNGYLLFGEECYDDDKLSKYPSLTLVGGVSGSYIISDFKNNKYEREADYMVYGYEEEKVSNGEATTLFMDVLSKMPMLSFQEKNNIRNVYFGVVKRTLE